MSALTGPSPATLERGEVFDCFGGNCAVWLDPGPNGPDADLTLQAVRRRLLGWHRRFTRFDASSELSQLNDDAREVVPISPTMARLIAAAIEAADLTGGLIDPTLLEQIELAGYARSLDPDPLPVELLLGLAPARTPAAPNLNSRISEISLSEDRGSVSRPLGLRLDGGGIAKGLFADMIGESLQSMRSYGVDCAGDLRLGGSGGSARVVAVASPFASESIHEYELREGAVATSGISRRSWLDQRGLPAHHLLDPSCGRPAFTGVVQVTALGPSAVEAEARAKAALLSGPERAAEWLVHGGVVVRDDASVEVI